jgi:hypothetical protein
MTLLKYNNSAVNYTLWPESITYGQLLVNTTLFEEVGV